MSGQLAPEVVAARTEAARDEALLWATAAPPAQEEAAADTWLRMLGCAGCVAGGSPPVLQTALAGAASSAPVTAPAAEGVQRS